MKNFESWYGILNMNNCNIITINNELMNAIFKVLACEKMTFRAEKLKC